MDEQQFAFIDDLSYLYETTTQELARQGILAQRAFNQYTDTQLELIRYLVSLVLETVQSIPQFHFYYEFIENEKGCELVESNAQLPINARLKDFLDEHVTDYIHSISQLLYTAGVLDAHESHQSQGSWVDIIVILVCKQCELLLLRITHTFEQYARQGIETSTPLVGLYQFDRLTIYSLGQRPLGPIVLDEGINLNYRSTTFWLKLKRLRYPTTGPSGHDPWL